MAQKEKKTTVQEAGRKGGLRTLERHGPQHFREIGKRRKGKRAK